MLYVKKGYEDYKYLVTISDNYVCLTNRSRATNETIPVIYQYINAPLTVIESQRQFSIYQDVTFPQIETSQKFFDSPMYPFYAISIIICVMFIVYIINPITKIVKKGGIFFGS